MSSPDPETAKDHQEGHKHSKRNFLKHHKHGKKSRSALDHEDTPLLADNAVNEDIEANGVEEGHSERPVGKQEKARTCFHTIGHWLWNNKMILAIVLVLLGGLVALIVYFTGMNSICTLEISAQESSSRLLPHIAKACSYLSHACLCGCGK